MSKDQKPTHLLEIDAMKRLSKVLDALPEDVRLRVLGWAARAYGAVGATTGGK